MNQLEEKLAILKTEYNQTAKSLSDWIKKHKKKKGYSKSNISKAKHGTASDTVVHKLIEFADEFIQYCKDNNNEYNNKQQNIIPSKLQMYCGQSFYIYYRSEEKSKLLPESFGIGRAILKIDANAHITIKSVEGLGYEGKVKLHTKSLDYLLFKFTTNKSHEKNSFLRVHIPKGVKGNVSKLLLGIISGIHGKGALLSSTAVLEKINTAKKEKEPKILFSNTEEFKSDIDINIAEYLSDKKVNTIKVKGSCFSINDLALFLASQKSKKENLAELNQQKSIFIAAPMNSVSNDEYIELRKDILKLIQFLKKRFNCPVYFAGEDKPQQNNFKDPSDSLKYSINKVDECNHFILFYPKKVVSSVLVEAAWAIKGNKECLFFAKEKKDLPYLFQNTERSTVHVRSYKTIDDIIILCGHLLK